MIDIYASWATSLTNTAWKLHGDDMTETFEGWSNDIETVSASLPLEITPVRLFACRQKNNNPK